VPLEDFKALNPSMNRPVIFAAGTTPPDPAASWDNAANGRIFRSINSIPPNMLIKAGSSLLVTRSTLLDADVAPSVADHGQMSLAPDVVLKRSVVQARKGDT
jgi:membrane-bound lytic murein transglycosylase D